MITGRCQSRSESGRRRRTRDQGYAHTGIQRLRRQQAGLGRCLEGGDQGQQARSRGPGLSEVAEREGFEPSVEVSPHTRLAGERLQPTRPSLRYSFSGFVNRRCAGPLAPAFSGTPGASTAALRINRPGDALTKLAEGVGFEPTELSLNGFQDRRLKPLGHPSRKRYGLLAPRPVRVNLFI